MKMLCPDPRTMRKLKIFLDLMIRLGFISVFAEDLKLTAKYETNGQEQHPMKTSDFKIGIRLSKFILLKHCATIRIVLLSLCLFVYQDVMGQSKEDGEGNFENEV